MNYLANSTVVAQVALTPGSSTQNQLTKEGVHLPKNPHGHSNCGTKFCTPLVKWCQENHPKHS